VRPLPRHRTFRPADRPRRRDAPATDVRSMKRVQRMICDGVEASAQFHHDVVSSYGGLNAPSSPSSRVG
jgi:hypothetical protein